MVDIDSAYKMSVDELAKLGRFNLRALLSTRAAYSLASFDMYTDNAQLAALVYSALHDTPLPSFNVSSSLLALFTHQHLLAMGTRNASQYRSYPFFVQARDAQGQLTYRVLSPREFCYDYINHQLELLSYNNRDTRWLDGEPDPGTVIFTLRREQIAGIGKEATKQCDGCGCHLTSCKVYDGKRCGDCQVALAGDHAWERERPELVRPIYAEPIARPKLATRFDPRPGIDDVGLGFYSPTWED